MTFLKKSPFKINRIENNPEAYGLRTKEIHDALRALNDNISILISGKRGIGKSSFGKQLQNVLEGNYILTKRCGIETIFPRYLCIYVAFDRTMTLAHMVQDIFFNIEQIFNVNRLRIKDTKASIEVNLGIVKGRIDSAIDRPENTPPASIASIFVSGIKLILDNISQTDYEGISIMIDEIDQMNSDINFGHFFKIIQERLNHYNLENISFIFAGQKGVYSRLIREDYSFERIVRHVPLTTLSVEASNFILVYAAGNSEPPFNIDEPANELIISLCSGYPYSIHLIGDSAYNDMESVIMNKQNVLRGIMKILQSDKREKYLSQLKNLTPNEKKLILAIAKNNSYKIPSETYLPDIKKKLDIYFADKQERISAIEELEKKGLIKYKRNIDSCIFEDELLRLFLWMLSYEQNQNKQSRLEITTKENYGIYEELDESTYATTWENYDFDDFL